MSDEGYRGPEFVDPNLLSKDEEEDITPIYDTKPVTPGFVDGTELDQILSMAIDNEASDIHLLVGCQPLLRIAKVLGPVDGLPEITIEQQQEFIKQLLKDDPRLVETYEQQKILDTNYNYNDIRFRINLSYSMDVPTISMRIIKAQLPPYKSLNLPDIIREYALKSQGLILITGKPGSGKSTTLSAIVNEINEAENKKILMLENPIEYVHTNKKSIIVQKDVSPFGDINSYHEGVVNSLREDCDVLAVGEIRDKATMDATIEMAETGHLVLGTMHTNSCAETIERIINFYPSEDQLTVKFMIANSLKLVVSQRMLRGEYGNLVMIPEVLVVDDHVGGIIKRDKYSSVEVEDAMQSGKDKGNIALVFSLADAVLDGKISMEQAKREVDFKRQELLVRVVAAGRQRKGY